ncbi:MAG TPA: protein kinase [Bacteroidota bacterium]
MVGKTISQYRILEEVGRGGMGVVYKAQDTKLDRMVALKFLPPHMNASEQDKARFVQEAKAASSINHPNICTIHDIQEHEKQLFIVMEYVDGQTLGERKGTMTFKQAIEIGIQIADGLAAAHDKGIVHRDIKPENIMVRKDGIAQIMDFGLAKLRGVSRLTKEGSTVGTAFYMSPEQVQGLEADHRSDIFSLGILLFELITGQLPFKGVHETAVMYEIVNVEAPPMSSVKPDVDPLLDSIILECLEKDANERTQSVKQVSIDLKRFRRESGRQKMSRAYSVSQAAAPVQSGIAQAQSPSPVRTIRLQEKIAWGLAGVALAALVFFLVNRSSSPISSHIPIVSSIEVPESIYIHSFGALLGPPVISPNGETIAFTGVTPDGTSKIYARSMSEKEPRALTGTENGFEPFWSPDGKTLGFFDAGKMKRVDLVGGSPTTITAVPNARGATWNVNGTIVYAADYQSGLFRVSADGKGKPEPVTVLDSTREEGSHRWPFFLPDGKHFLFLVRTASETGEAEGDAIFVASLDGGEKKILVQSSFNPAYADGYLLFARGSNLLAQRFDPDALSLSGDPLKLQDGVLSDLSYNMAVFTVSNTGTLLYQTGEALAGARPLFLDRTGGVVRILDDRNEQNMPRFSRDGKQLALYLYDIRSRRSNIWIYDLQTGGRRRLTTRAEGDFFPVWSADGSNVYFLSGHDAYVQSIGHGGDGTLFLSLSGFTLVYDISRDGKAILVQTSPNRGLTNADLWIVRGNEKEAKPIPFQKTKFDEGFGRISPNSKWVAYMSDESGGVEVYLKRVSAPESDPWRISSGGGVGPVWGRESNELFYVNDKNQMVVVSLQFAGEKGEVVSIKPLFPMPAFTSSYDLSPDGKTFVICRSLEMQKFPHLSLVVNWKGLLEQR